MSSDARDAPTPPASEPSLGDSIALALRASEEAWLAVQLRSGMGLYLVLLLSALCIDAVLLLDGRVTDRAGLVLARLLPLPLIGVTYLRATRTPRLSYRETQRWLVAIDLTTTLWIALVARTSGGLASPAYIMQFFVPLSMLVIPMPWKYGVVRHALAFVAFLGLALGLHAVAVREGHGSWRAANYDLFVVLAMCVHALSTSVVGVAHRLWVLRRAEASTRNVGRYELRRKLGIGGMGEVWAAWHTTMRREVALKIVRVRGASDDDLARRFEREIQAMVKLRHPSTVRVFDFGAEPGGLLYYAMELLEGETLGDRVARDGALSLATVHRIALDTARALAEAHEHGIVHRDVKPDNVFLSKAGGDDDLVKILDFGIAFVAESTDDRLTSEGMIAGTASTISPEILRGELATPASDVYSLGCVLYFMLTGTMPFGTSKSMKVFEAHLNLEPTPPSLVRGARVHDTLERIVLDCLRKTASERPADGGALVARLTAIDVRELDRSEAPRPVARAVARDEPTPRVSKRAR